MVLSLFWRWINDHKFPIIYLLLVVESPGYLSDSPPSRAQACRPAWLCTAPASSASRPSWHSKQKTESSTATSLPSVSAASFSSSLVLPVLVLDLGWLYLGSSFTLNSSLGFLSFSYMVRGSILGEGEPDTWAGIQKQAQCYQLKLPPTDYRAIIYSLSNRNEKKIIWWNKWYCFSSDLRAKTKSHWIVAIKTNLWFHFQ